MACLHLEWLPPSFIQPASPAKGEFPSGAPTCKTGWPQIGTISLSKQSSHMHKDFNGSLRRTLTTTCWEFQFSTEDRQTSFTSGFLQAQSWCPQQSTSQAHFLSAFPSEAYKAHTSRGTVQLNRDSFSFHRSAGTSLQLPCTTLSTQVGIHGGVAFTSIPCTTERASLHSASRSKPFAHATRQAAYRGDRGNLQCYHQCQTSPALSLWETQHPC